MSKNTHEAVFKAVDDDEHIVMAEVYAPLIPDSDGDIMDAETIKKMAHDFLKMQKLNQVDVQHDNNLNPGASVVESFIARKGDPIFIEGAWVVGMHIPDDTTWARIKKGEINGFSIEAMVTKTPMELEMDIPPVINGKTTKSEDHEHEFFVTFDANGKFMGGRTSIAKAHFHNIRAGTMTETEQGHNHKFSFVENFGAPEQIFGSIPVAKEESQQESQQEAQQEVVAELVQVTAPSEVVEKEEIIPTIKYASGEWEVYNEETGEVLFIRSNVRKAMQKVAELNAVNPVHGARVFVPIEEVTPAITPEVLEAVQGA